MVGTTHEIMEKASAEIHLAIIDLHRQRREMTDAEMILHSATQLRDFTRMQNAINNIAFAIRDLTLRSPYSLYNDSSVLIGFFETNQLVGYSSMPVTVESTLYSIREICEQLAPPCGQHIMLFRQIVKFVDMLFQLKVSFSLYYHALEQP